MKELNNESPNDFETINRDRSIDIVGMVMNIWLGRKLLLITTSLFLFFGILIALLSPVKYSASAVVLPSIDTKASGLGNLGALAGMAGINLSSMLGQGNSFDPALYPKVATSIPFLFELMNKKIYWAEYSDSLSFFEYKERLDKKMTIAKYISQLPEATISLFTSTPINKNLYTGNRNGYYELSESQIGAMDYLSSLISVDYAKSTDLITIRVTLSEPLAVAQLTQNALELFQKHIVSYKIKKVADNLGFLENRVNEKRMEYELLQNKLLTYKDTHRNLVRERTDFEYQKLSDAYDITVNVYKGLMQSLEQSRIAVKEETPVFSVIMPVVVPIIKDSPKRGVIVVGMMGFGFFIGIGLIYLFKFINTLEFEWIRENRLFNKLKFFAGII